MWSSKRRFQESHKPAKNDHSLQLLTWFHQLVRHWKVKTARVQGLAYPAYCDSQCLRQIWALIAAGSAKICHFDCDLHHNAAFAEGSGHVSPPAEVLTNAGPTAACAV